MRELFIFLLNLHLAFSVQAIRESIPMKNLSCYNDYKSQVTCTWLEHSEAHALVGMTLYQRDSIAVENREMFCTNQTEKDSYIHWVCRNTTNKFGIGVQYVYSFKPNKMLQAELDVDLFKNVQTLPPQNLSASLMGSEAILLTWKAADGSQVLGNALDYEVTYKQDWESWEKAASLLLSNTTHCNLSCEDLVPGSSYVARVRARPGQASGSSGQYSEWSTEVSWQTPEGGLHPRNLRCLFNGADRLTCSWVVKKAITTSVLFGLFFKATPASAEEECSPVHEKALPHIPYVLQSCEIPVSSPSSQSQYHVSVRAKTEEKITESYKNIKVLPPTNVSVILTENQEYELRWIKHTLGYNFIKQRYQFEYWKNNQYEKTHQTLDINNDEPPFILTLQMLASSTEYRGKMRARVNTPLDYEGPWSEWSEEFAWKTENVLPTVVLPVMLSALIIPLLIVTYCSYKCFLRKKKMWEEKIPNPSKSLLIQSYQKVHLGNWSTSSQLDFNKYSLSEKMEQASFLQIVHKESKTLAESPEGQAKKTDVSHVALDLQNSYHALNEPEHAPVACSSQSAGDSFPVSRRNSAVANIASQTATPCFAFNGPYLYSPVMSSQPNLHQTLQVDPVRVREKSGSLQYVTLPKEDCPQAPQRQEQPGAGPAQPFLLPNQKEMTQHLNNEKEVSPTPPACGEGTNIRTQEHKFRKALSCITPPQQCPLEYITTDSLLLPSASDSSPPPLVTAEELPCDAQEPQPPRSHHSCHESSPGKTGVMVPVAGQAPTSSPELHLDTFGDYLTVPLGFHEHSELTKISLPVLQKGNDLPRKQPLSEGNLVVLNPDSTEPVFLCQVGDYCFHSLKTNVKMDTNQEDHQVKKPPEGKTTPEKPLSDDESITGKKNDVSKMQAIQLFKNLKSDDYFSWQQSLRITEIC